MSASWQNEQLQQKLSSGPKKKKVASKYKQMLFQTIEVKWQQNEERKEETNKVKMYIIYKHEKEEIA